MRATALYFRYGGVASSAFGIARGGLTLASAANSFRWSGLSSRFGSFDLTTLAGNAAKSYATRRLYAFGSLARLQNVGSTVSGIQITRPRAELLGRVMPSGSDVRDSIFDRLDPTRQADRLSAYLLRKRRLAELRGGHMYYFTDLAKPFDRKGLVGVNVQTGEDSRFVLASDPDPRFLIDESLGLFYTSDGSRMQAFPVLDR